jgi:hypothetical protein
MILGEFLLLIKACFLAVAQLDDPFATEWAHRKIVLVQQGTAAALRPAIRRSAVCISSTIATREK